MKLTPIQLNRVASLRHSMMMEPYWGIIKISKMLSFSCSSRFRVNKEITCFKN